MSFRSLAAGALLGAVAAVLPLTGAWAGELVDTKLQLKTELGPQLLSLDQPLEPGSQIRLAVEAKADVTVSVQWRPSARALQSLADDTKLAKGGTLTVPPAGGWLAVGDDSGRAAFQVMATDAAGKVEQLATGYIVLDEKIATLDAQQQFTALKKAKPVGEGQPAGSFTSFSGQVFAGNKATGFAAQLAKVPPEPPTFAQSAGASLFKSVVDGVVLVLTNEGIGSGSMITPDGLIVTNWHVIAGYEVVGIVFRPPQGTPLSEDMIVLADVVKIGEGLDLALLRLQQVPADKPVLALGDIASVDVGNEVHAIGHPYGESWTYTRGYVSQIRDGYEWQTEMGVPHKAQIIQTQTPINPGNSGGPLFDDTGMIIGVNSFVAEQGQGLNYAVSVKDVQAFLQNDQVAQLGQPAQPAQPGQPAQPAQPGQPGLGQPQKPQPPQRKKEPEFEPLDVNGNGKVDAYAADRNGDGQYDVILVDENEDGVIDYALFDDNFNGVPDATLVMAEDDQGPYMVWIFDENEDGEPDYYGFDWDQDGTIDDWQQA